MINPVFGVDFYPYNDGYGIIGFIYRCKCGREIMLVFGEDVCKCGFRVDDNIDFDAIYEEWLNKKSPE